MRSAHHQENGGFSSNQAKSCTAKKLSPLLGGFVCTKLIFLLYTIWKVRSTQDTYIELEDAYNLLLPIYFFHLCVYAEENMQCRHDMMSNCRLFEPYSKWNSDIDQAIKANSSLGIFSMPWLGRLVKRVKSFDVGDAHSDREEESFRN